MVIAWAFVNDQDEDSDFDDSFTPRTAPARNVVIWTGTAGDGWIIAGVEPSRDAGHSAIP